MSTLNGLNASSCMKTRLDLQEGLTWRHGGPHILGKAKNDSRTRPPCTPVVFRKPSNEWRRGGKEAQTRDSKQYRRSKSRMKKRMSLRTTRENSKKQMGLSNLVPGDHIGQRRVPASSAVPALREREGHLLRETVGKTDTMW
jgi:hypothetical protein